MRPTVTNSSVDTRVCIVTNVFFNWLHKMWNFSKILSDASSRAPRLSSSGIGVQSANRMKKLVKAVFRGINTVAFKRPELKHLTICRQKWDPPARSKQFFLDFHILETSDTNDHVCAFVFKYCILMIKKKKGGGETCLKNVFVTAV